MKIKKDNKNYLLTGQRNFNLGQIEYAKHLLEYLFVNGKLIPSESNAIRSAIINLGNIYAIPASERQEIFGKINGFKKYTKNEKI